jgi:transcription-repair coupling factor (superfamily II helicase)
VAESKGLARVLELVGPSLRDANASGSFTPSNFATPLAVAAYCLESPFVVALTATSTEAEQLRDALAALTGDDVALWPAWDTHPLERVSPDAAAMATRTLLRWRLSNARTRASWSRRRGRSPSCWHPRSCVTRSLCAEARR